MVIYWQLLMMFTRDRRGMTSVEYAIIAGVLTVSLLATFAAFGTRLKNFMPTISL